MLEADVHPVSQPVSFTKNGANLLANSVAAVAAVEITITERFTTKKGRNATFLMKSSLAFNSAYGYTRLASFR